MSHRIHKSQAVASEASFYGRLDEAALASLRALRLSGGTTRLVLREGTEVVPECVPDLLALDFVVRAESPYLAHWLESARADSLRRTTK